MGDVELTGDNLPRGLLIAGEFAKGKLANGKQMEQGAQKMEQYLKSTYHVLAAARTQRIFDDAGHVLSLHIFIATRPFYRPGEVRQMGVVRFSGLSSVLEAQARSLWKLKAGDRYDYAYLADFLLAFSEAADLRNFRILPKTKRGAGDRIVDIDIAFEPRQNRRLGPV